MDAMSTGLHLSLQLDGERQSFLIQEPIQGRAVLFNEYNRPLLYADVFLFFRVIAAPQPIREEVVERKHLVGSATSGVPHVEERFVFSAPLMPISHENAAFRLEWFLGLRACLQGGEEQSLEIPIQILEERIALREAEKSPPSNEVAPAPPVSTPACSAPPEPSDPIQRVIDGSPEVGRRKFSEDPRGKPWVQYAIGQRIELRPAKTVIEGRGYPFFTSVAVDWENRHLVLEECDDKMGSTWGESVVLPLSEEQLEEIQRALWPRLILPRIEATTPLPLHAPAPDVVTIPKPSASIDSSQPSTDGFADVGPQSPRCGPGEKPRAQDSALKDPTKLLLCPVDPLQQLIDRSQKVATVSWFNNPRGRPWIQYVENRSLDPLPEQTSFSYGGYPIQTDVTIDWMAQRIYVEEYDNKIGGPTGDSVVLFASQEELEEIKHAIRSLPAPPVLVPPPPRPPAVRVSLGPPPAKLLPRPVDPIQTLIDGSREVDSVAWYDDPRGRSWVRVAKEQPHLDQPPKKTVIRSEGLMQPDALIELTIDWEEQQLTIEETRPQRGEITGHIVLSVRKKDLEEFRCALWSSS